MKFFALQLTKEEFNGNLTELNELFIIPLGLFMKNETLANNLLTWMSYVFVSYLNGKSQSIQFSAVPSQVFNRQYTFIGLADANNVCTSQYFTSFDPISSIVQVTWDIDEYYIANCSEILNPYSAGYYQELSSYQLQIEVDMISFVTAASVNLGMLPFYFLQKIKNKLYEEIYFYVNDVVYGIHVMIDPRYPEMHPIYCFIKLYGNDNISEFSFDQYCFISIGFQVNSQYPTIGIPILNHVGAHDFFVNITEIYYPEDCTCENYNPICNDISLLASLIIFDPSKNDDSFTSSIYNTLYTIMSHRPFDMVKTVYNSSYYSAFSTNNNPDKEYAKKLYTESFSYCVGNCTLLTFGFADDIDHYISDYYYDLINGSCGDTITSPYFDKASENPPVQLTEVYYQCFTFDADAWTNSLGIASGNIALYIPVFVLLLLPVIYFYLTIIGFVPPKEEYLKQEKELALEEFALQLLRARDGRIRGFKSDYIILKLAKELCKTAVATGGFIDSDDEDDDDSDEEELSIGSKIKFEKRKSILYDKHKPKRRSSTVAIPQINTNTLNNSIPISQKNPLFETELKSLTIKPPKIVNFVVPQITSKIQILNKNLSSSLNGKLSGFDRIISFLESILRDLVNSKNFEKNEDKIRIGKSSINLTGNLKLINYFEDINNTSNIENNRCIIKLLYQILHWHTCLSLNEFDAKLILDDSIGYQIGDSIFSGKFMLAYIDNNI
jgi:hypothetical protein